MIGRAYNIPNVALRFFNVYGPRQALSDPYTGALGIFRLSFAQRQAPRSLKMVNNNATSLMSEMWCRLAGYLSTPPPHRSEFPTSAAGQALPTSELAERMADALEKISSRI